MLNHFKPPTKQQERRKEELNTEIVNWDLIYKIPFYCTKNNQFSVFQCKILHRILSTNSLLFKCKLNETLLCNFCNEAKEIILHLFWECNIVKSLWLEMAEILKNKCNVEIPISAQHIILGSDMLDYSINIFIVLIKYYIYSCRFSGQKQCVSSVVNILKRTDEIEVQSASFYQTPVIRETIVKKWEDIKIILI